MTSTDGIYDLVSRQAMLEGLREMPAILPFVSMLYGGPSSYLWEDALGRARGRLRSGTEPARNHQDAKCWSKEQETWIQRRWCGEVRVTSLSTRHQCLRHSVGTGGVHPGLRWTSGASRSDPAAGKHAGVVVVGPLIAQQPDQTTPRESLSQEPQKIFAEPMTSSCGGVSVPSCRSSRCNQQK